ncbi:MAG: right-handed parallel beta-helix repeat-containing protein [Planctomycetota bacterium]
MRFWQGEDANSVVAGLTIINGYAPITAPHRVATGGAIDCLNSSPTIRQCVIRGNLAGVGGGIYCGRSESIISDCVITGNSARYGGGIRLNLCQSEINNCLITDNTAWERMGAGIIVSWGDAAITNCTISNNTADNNGGGMYCDEATVTMTNCILWDNSPTEITEGPGGNATVTYCDIQGGWPGEGNIEADPCFADANNGDYHLLTDSRCIDAGTDAGVYTDIEGTERPFDYPGVDNNGDLPDFDMGAYEAYEAHPYRIAVLNIERAIAEKIEAMARINSAMDKELEAYEALEILLESGDYGDLKKGDIIGAEQKIHSAVQHQEQSTDALEKSIGKLQDSLSELGCEVEPNQSND